MNGAPLLDYIAAHEARYPHKPGSKGHHGTSERAADEVKGRVALLRDQCIECLREHGPKTADEIASLLHESPLSIRPRCSELLRLGKIVATGLRRRNTVSSKLASVWALNPGPLQREAPANDQAQIITGKAA